MAMSAGGSASSVKADINVTPMIDVLLVLIIIFMVITPLAPKGLHTLLPQNPTAQDDTGPAHDIVVTVRQDGSFLLNREPLSQSALEARLSQLYRNGAANVVFVRAERDLEFRQVAEAIDLARGVGVDRIALMPY